MTTNNYKNMLDQLTAPAYQNTIKVLLTDGLIRDMISEFYCFTKRANVL